MRLRPQRDAVLPPPAAVCPARQRFAGVPFALPEVQQTARREAITQAAQERIGAQSLRWAKRRGVPFGGVAIVDADERRFAPHGQSHVIGVQLGVDRVAELVDGAPYLLGVWLCDARRF